MRMGAVEARLQQPEANTNPDLRPRKGETERENQAPPPLVNYRGICIDINVLKCLELRGEGGNNNMKR
ncbi:unnamed protein product [Linum trigynum]|uniref:Uncharacterized protein n=1 Tax=Linum trigynum TaxID=586398 RepID=A0AAV2FAF2_9ROSI